MNDFKTCPHASLVQEERERTGYVCRGCGAQADERVWQALSEAREDAFLSVVAERESAQTADLAAKALFGAEWTEHGGPVYSCTGCASGWSFQRVHSPTCRVDAALTRLGYPDRASRDKALRKLRDDDFNERWRPKPAAPAERAPDAAHHEECAARWGGEPCTCGVVRAPDRPRPVVPDSPSSDPDFDSDPDDGGD